MQRDNEILDELRELDSSLANIDKINVYDLPVGYFDDFGKKLQLEIENIKIESELKTISATKTLEIPDVYFENFAANMVATIAAEGMKLPQKNAEVFDVPENYFADLPEKMVAQLKETNVDKGINGKTKPKRIDIAFLLKWAIAAIFVIGFGISAYYTFINSKLNNTETILSSLPKNELKEYMEQNAYDFDSEQIVSSRMDNKLKLDNNEIVQYLSESGWD